MTDTPATRLLSAILGEPQPCGHIERFVAFMAEGHVRISSGFSEDVAPEIECVECDVVMGFEDFSRLLIGAMQGRN